MSTIPAAWMPAVPMKRVICHWTAGGHRANATDRRAYHVLVEGDGNLVQGDASIALNSDSIKSGYAAHTLNCNIDSVGISMCGMAGAVEHPWKPGPQPLTRPQWDAFVRAVADLCETYSIPVTPRTVLFHAEVQASLGIKQRNKWDVTRLVFDDTRGARAIGDKMRAEVEAALGGEVSDPEPDPEPAGGITGGTGRVTTDNLNFRRGPGTSHEATGSLPEGTALEIVERKGAWMQVTTPAGYTGWVHGGYVNLIDTAPPEDATTPDPLHDEFAAIRDRLDEIEADMPDDRDRLSRALDAVMAQLTNV